MVLDYRTLNKNCEFDSYKIPDKNNLISLIENRKIFSKFDCKSGFWQSKCIQTLYRGQPLVYHKKNTSNL